MSALRAEEPRLLIVDDDPGMRDTLGDILESMAYQVALAADGATALDKIRDQRYDLVVMDVRMPILDGVETLKRMRALRPDLLVILMSGDPGAAALAEVRQQAVAIVPKPLDLQALLPLIEALTSERGTPP